jgi:outer membrane protein assembly factor BamE
VFSDEVTKQLDLQFDAAAQRWLIVREFVVANGKRASEQKILAPEESSEHLDGVIEKIGF